MSSAPPPVRWLPREHGTWAMLLVPWAVGSGVGGRQLADELLLLLGSVGLFLAHTHLMTWGRLRLGKRSDPRAARAARRLVLLFGALGLAATAPLLARSRLPGLLLLAAAAGVLTAVSLRLVARRADHALPGQVLAAVGLSLTAPAAYYVATAALDRRALALWLLNAAFFLWAVFYVRLKIEARARRAPLASAWARLAFARGTLALDAALLLGAAAALRLGAFPMPALAAFLPAAAQTGAGVARLDRSPALKRVGILLTAHALLWALLVIWLA